MKRYIKTYFTCGLLLVGLLSACKEEDMTLGEGSVRLNVKVSDEVAVVSRAIDPGIYASMQTRIYSSKGLIRYYDRENLMPDILNLASGQYHVFVIAGDSVPAAFDTPYYTGSADFAVQSGETTSAEVKCTIANTLATVAFSPELANVVTDYKVKIFTTTGELSFTESTVDSVGYYMLNGKDRNLAWSFEGKKTDGKNYTQSGVVENVVKATKYAFTFSYNADNAATGGTFIDVKVNESTVDSTHNVVITQRPQIVGDKFDITQPLYYETNSGKEAAIWVNAATKLKNVKLSCEKFPSLRVYYHCFVRGMPIFETAVGQCRRFFGSERYRFYRGLCSCNGLIFVCRSRFELRYLGRHTCSRQDGRNGYPFLRTGFAILERESFRCFFYQSP